MVKKKFKSYTEALKNRKYDEVTIHLPDEKKLQWKNIRSPHYPKSPWT